MQPFRRYVSVAHVGPFGAHYMVWYDADLARSHVLVVPESGGARAVELWGDVGGGVPKPAPGLPVSTPKEHIEAIRRTLPARAKDLSIGALGWYREILAFEVMPAAADSPQLANTEQWRIAADERLEHLATPVAPYEPSPAMQWPRHWACSEPYWVRIPGTYPEDGRSLLRRFRIEAQHSTSGASPVVSAILAAARERDRGQRSVRALEVSSDQGRGLLPASLVQSVEMTLQVTLVARHAGGERVGVLRVALPTGDLAFRVARGSGELILAGLHLKGDVEISAELGRASRAPGKYSPELKGTLRVTDSQGAEGTLRFAARGELLLDGPRAALVQPIPPKAWGALPSTLELPGFGQWTSVRVEPEAIAPIVD